MTPLQQPVPFIFSFYFPFPGCRKRPPIQIFLLNALAVPRSGLAEWHCPGTCVPLQTGSHLGGEYRQGGFRNCFDKPRKSLAKPPYTNTALAAETKRGFNRHSSPSTSARGCFLTLTSKSHYHTTFFLFFLKESKGETQYPLPPYPL